MSQDTQSKTTHADTSRADTSRHDTSLNATRRDDQKRIDTNLRKFSRSYDVQQLVERLSAANVGETIEYGEIESIVGGPHGSPKYAGRIQSARKIVQAEKRYVFGVSKGVGLVRLNDAAIVTTGAETIAKIRRASVRGMKRLACVEYEQMSNDDKRKHDAAASHLGILAECSRPAATKAIASKVSEAEKTLTFDETLKAFRS